MISREPRQLGRRGFTVVEALVSLLSLSVLLMGGAAIVSLSSRAAPDRLTIASEAGDALAALDRFESDLSVAYAVTWDGATLGLVRPSVADRGVARRFHTGRQRAAA